DKPPDRDNLTVTLKAPDGAKLPEYDDKDSLRPLLRRWDHRGTLDEFDGALPITTKPNASDGTLDGWIDLEDGIQVWFSEDGEYHTGDYWLVPARTATGNVEWPMEPDTDAVPAALEPHGPHHHYAPILLSLPPTSGPGRDNQDCRCRIERLPCAGYAYAFGGRGIGPNFENMSTTRAVWSYWSKPYEARRHEPWPSERHHLLSWVLSTMTARRHYGETTLCTDDAGARLLVDGIGLEFEHVSTALNALHVSNPDWWALGKLYAYRMQTEPFVHIDSDVFLWRPLSPDPASVPLL